MTAVNEISLAEYQAETWKSMTEKAFQSQVIRAARSRGWTHIYHTQHSIHSAKGYPDLHLLRGTRSLFIELKTMKGRISDAQTEWCRALDAAGHEAYIFRPSDMAEIDRLLK